MIEPDMNNINDFAQIAILIEESRNRAFQKVNEELVLLYFRVGHIVTEKVTAGAWGSGTVDELAKYIAERLPGLAGFNRRGIYRMMQFYETYDLSSDCFLLWVQSQTPIVSPLATQLLTHEDDIGKVSPMATQIQDIYYQHNKFVSAVLTQISWTNHLEIFSAIKNAEQRLFYILMSVKEKWSKLELRRQIQSAFFERTMMGNNIHSLLQPHLPENLFKDPYIFEFLDLPDVHSEKDLEKALILNLQKFILEIGKGYTYMGNQYRIQVGKKDYNTDLLFFNRDLQCLVMFELKISEFEPEFLGKLNFYLEALDRDVKRPHEKPSIGVLLCKGKDSEVVEYAMARNTSPALIADYETKLIPKSILAKKLHQLVEQLSKENDK
ncbi:MAG: PDDEXK nuclease domain-containing protein [Bacteroidota bacterium]|nr:PDDEXK nuclease domain-containing protein [Bacteroidota bacterium]